MTKDPKDKPRQSQASQQATKKKKTEVTHNNYMANVPKCNARTCETTKEREREKAQKARRTTRL